MSDKDFQNTNCKPMTYATYFIIFRQIALEFGYNLVIHGSMNNDFDLVAIAWADELGDEIEMLRRFRKVIMDYERADGNPYDTVEVKPHGRVAYTIQSGGGGYIDISIIGHKK